MTQRVSFRAIRVAVAAVILAATASNAPAFSILGHRVIALRVLHAVRNDPSAYPPFLSKIANDETLIRYFLGGTDAPDLGAIAGVPPPDIQYSTHYEHPGLWIKTLFGLARDDNERAYAWGWVVHEGADLQIHPWMDEHGLNFCDVPFGAAHTYFEIVMDSEFGSTYAQYWDEGVHGQSSHPLRLLKEARHVVGSASERSADYDDYIKRLRKRCGKSSGAGGQGQQTASDQAYSPLTFKAIKETELLIGKIATEGSTFERALLRASAAASSAAEREAWSVLAGVVERERQKVESVLALLRLRTADNAEIVNLYGFAPGKIKEMLRAAEKGDWQALDLNFDTGEAVHDPALGSGRGLPVIDIALVLDSSGSMQESDPNDLRKRAAELLIDRSPDLARFTVVRFNNEVSLLAERSSDRQQLRNAIGAVGADGGTLLCKATFATLDALARGEGEEKAIVLLTDGKSQDNCDPAELARRGVRIFTVGLSNEANGALLQAIAAATNASYVDARSAADIQSVFDIIVAQVLNQSSIADFNGMAVPGATSRFRFPIDSTVRDFTVMLTWPGSKLDLTLLSPSGKRLSASIEGRTAPTYQMVDVTSPESGTWTATVKSVEVAQAGEPFRLRAAADTPVRLVLQPLDSQGSPSMRASLERFPATPAQVRVRVERPDGKSDDADVDQEGRSFVARYPRADVPGAYNFTWSALAGSVSRVATRSIFVGETAIQGGTVQSVEGQYVRWNRGSLHGIRHGLPVTIVRQGQEIGRGRAIDVRPADADIEIDAVSGVADIVVGDEVHIEIASWTADTVQP